MSSAPGAVRALAFLEQPVAEKGDDGLEAVLGADLEDFLPELGRGTDGLEADRYCGCRKKGGMSIFAASEDGEREREREKKSERFGEGDLIRGRGPMR